MADSETECIPDSPKTIIKYKKKRRRRKHRHKSTLLKNIKNKSLSQQNNEKSEFDINLLYDNVELILNKKKNSPDEAIIVPNSNAIFNELKLLEKGNNLDVINKSKKDINFIVTNDFLPLSQFSKIISSPRQDNQSNTFDRKYLQFETQLSVSHTQLTNIIEAADEAENLLKSDLQFSQWNIHPLASPFTNKQHEEKNDQEMDKMNCKRKSAEINEFNIDDADIEVNKNIEQGVETSSSKRIKITPKLECLELTNESTPIQNSITTTTKNITSQKNPRKLNFDIADASISSVSDNDFEEDADFIYDKSPKQHNERQSLMDFDLNTSLKIIDNIHNLSVYYSQSSQHQCSQHSQQSEICAEEFSMNDIKETDNTFEGVNTSGIEINIDCNNLNNTFTIKSSLNENNIGLNSSTRGENVDMTKQYIKESCSTQPYKIGNMLENVKENCISNQNTFNTEIFDENKLINDNENLSQQRITNELIEPEINNNVNTNKFELDCLIPQNYNNKNYRKIYECDVDALPSDMHKNKLTKKCKTSFENNDNDNNNIIGFKTALGNCISLSKANLQKYTNIFDQEFGGFNDNINDKNIENDCNDDDDIIKIPDNRKTITSDKYNNLIEANINKFGNINTGFKTANGNEIESSKQNFQKYSKIFDEEFELSNNLYDDKDKRMCNILSEKMTEFDMKPVHNPMTRNFNTGFRTATGNAIPLSTNNLQKYTKIFEQEFELSNNLNHDEDKKMSNTISDKMIDCDMNPINNSMINNINTGFRTATGNAIPLSTNNLHKYTKIFEEEFRLVPNLNESQILDNKTSNNLIQDITNANGDILLESIKYDNENLINTGFKTAHGNKIPLSKENFEKYTDIFNKEFALSIENDNFINKNKTVINNDKENHIKLNDNIIRIPIIDSTINRRQTYLNPIENKLEKYCSSPTKFNNFQNKSTLFSTQLNSSTPLKPITATSLSPITKIKRNTISLTQEVTSSTNALIEDEINNLNLDMTPQDVEAFFIANFNSPKNSKLYNMKEKLRPSRLIFDTSNDADENENQLEQNNSSDATINNVSMDTNLNCVNDEIKKLRKNELVEQQNNIYHKLNRIKCPSTLLIKKMLSQRQQLKEFVNGIRPTSYTIDDLLKYRLSRQTILLNSNNYLNYKFNMFDYYTENECKTNYLGFLYADDIQIIMNENCYVTFNELAIGFLNSPTIDIKLLPLPMKWLQNAYKWILIKLSAMERSFPHKFGGQLLTLENVLLQLKYRYNREIDNAERSSVRKIYERDDSAEKSIILFVSNILECETFEYKLELCDGWYSIMAKIDLALIELIRNGKIKIGTKLLIQGAKLISATVEGCSPLEINDMENMSIYLKISANLTRRVKWYTKLGYFNKCKIPLHITLNSVLENGGQIGKLIICILRVYPMMYVDKSIKEGANAVFRSEKLQNVINQKNEQKRVEIYNKIYNETMNEKRESIKNILNFSNTRKISEITDPEELYNLIQYGCDTELIVEEMTSTQKRIVNDFQCQENNKLIDEINRKVETIFNSTVLMEHSVTPLLKLKIIDANEPNKIAMLSVWNPSQDVIEILKERNIVEIINVSASGMRYGELQITAGKSSRYQLIKLNFNDNEMISLRYYRKVTPINEIMNSMPSPSSFQPLFNEFDCVGFVISIDSQCCGDNNKSNKFQSVYICDNEKKILCIKFWCNIKAYAYDNIIKIGKFLAISNLQWRYNSNNGKCSIPNSYAMDFTVFTEHPRSELLKTNLIHLINTFKTIDIQSYITECLAIIKHSIRNQYQPSPMKPSSSIINTPNRQNVTTTPIMQQRSIFNNNNLIRNISTPIEFSPGVGHPVSSLQERINKLERYGEPPSLSPIVLNKCKSLISNFKPPTTKS